VTHVEVKLKKIKELEKTTGTITYMLRLDPECVPEAVWRQCSAQEYFVALSNRNFGGMVQTKTILNLYDGGESREFI
jgi:hypothetical protein